MDRCYNDVAVTHLIAAPYFYMTTLPNSYRARDFASANSLAELFREDHVFSFPKKSVVVYSSVSSTASGKCTALARTPGSGQVAPTLDGRHRRLSLHLRLLRHLQRAVDLDAEVPHSALRFRVWSSNGTARRSRRGLRAIGWKSERVPTPETVAAVIVQLLSVLEIQESEPFALAQVG